MATLKELQLANPIGTRFRRAIWRPYKPAQPNISIGFIEFDGVVWRSANGVKFMDTRTNPFEGQDWLVCAKEPITWNGEVTLVKDTLINLWISALVPDSLHGRLVKVTIEEVL